MTTLTSKNARPGAITVPLTEPGPNWSQREYVACLKQRIGFSAHGHRSGLRTYFHYKWAGPEARCVTAALGISGDVVVRTVEHDFAPGVQWIQQCAQAMYEIERDKGGK